MTYFNFDSRGSPNLVLVFVCDYFETLNSKF
jgi:hypothetical protein